MIHFGWVLGPALVIALIGFVLFFFEDSTDRRGIGIVLALIGIAGCGYVIAARSCSTGGWIVQTESSYAVQDVKTPSGASIQVIIDADERVIELTHMTGKIFPAGVVKRQVMMMEPYMNLSWGEFKVQWVPGDSKMPPQPAKLIEEDK